MSRASRSATWTHGGRRSRLRVAGEDVHVQAPAAALDAEEEASSDPARTCGRTSRHRAQKGLVEAALRRRCSSRSADWTSMHSCTRESPWASRPVLRVEARVVDRLRLRPDTNVGLPLNSCVDDPHVGPCHCVWLDPSPSAAAPVASHPPSFVTRPQRDGLGGGLGNRHRDSAGIRRASAREHGLLPISYANVHCVRYEQRGGHQAAACRDPWRNAGGRGSHQNFTHPTKRGRVTVPHPRKDLYVRTLRNIYRQAGWDWRDR